MLPAGLSPIGKLLLLLWLVHTCRGARHLHLLLLHLEEDPGRIHGRPRHHGVDQLGGRLVSSGAHPPSQISPPGEELGPAGPASSGAVGTAQVLLQVRAPQRLERAVVAVQDVPLQPSQRCRTHKCSCQMTPTASPPKSSRLWPKVAANCNKNVQVAEGAGKSVYYFSSSGNRELSD